MFAGRYGFLPDSEVPFGRLQPYIAVGPALFCVQPEAYDQLPLFLVFRMLESANGGQDGFNVGLGVETGLRYFFNRSYFSGSFI